METQSFASVVLTHPLFAAFVAAVMVHAGYSFFRWRADAAILAAGKIIVEEQYRVATQDEVQALLKAAERQGKHDFAEAKLDGIRRLHGDSLKFGHLWWTWWQVCGLVPAHVPAPACMRGKDGLERATKDGLDKTVASVLFKKW